VQPITLLTLRAMASSLYISAIIKSLLMAKSIAAGLMALYIQNWILLYSNHFH
jgi:hypothetical protein